MDAFSDFDPIVSLQAKLAMRQSNLSQSRRGDGRRCLGAHAHVLRHEGPGADEDEQGFPFVGRAGKKLTERDPKWDPEDGADPESCLTKDSLKFEQKHPQKLRFRLNAKAARVL